MDGEYPKNAQPRAEVPYYRPPPSTPSFASGQPPYPPYFPPPDMSRPPPGFMAPPHFPYPSPPSMQTAPENESTAGKGTSAQIGDMLHKLRQSVDNMDDQQYVESWFISKGYTQSQRTLKRAEKTEGSLSIPDARKCLRESLLLLQRLKSDSVGSELQHATIERLNQLQSVLTDPKNLDTLKLKILKAARKRGRLKRKQQRDFEEKMEAEEKRKEKHAVLDKWREQMTQMAMDVKKEKELKASADETLMEVRKKLADVSRFEDILASLEKLRKIRMEKLHQRGLDPGPDGEHMFQARKSNMTEMLRTHRQNYEIEKKGLEVILETEKEENEAKQRKKDQKNLKSYLTKYERDLHEFLFGPQTVYNSDDPILPYLQYQLGAESDVNTLIHIRHEWDSHLVHPDVPGASSVPVGWVIPVEPSDSSWETLLNSSVK
ncbi:hypothetical protein CAPTEDRAFT_192396 [Capitella teleta]|uniref:Programmed cell death protein 7 n=1 Tax=Capitella teleta TaxID=283909 RepID=R7TTL7_CAPTE|nr:hypothetical protein CAPTEDRAFT_192396 [Capitella teleta]|eukprot:ELT97258.1 hypothetical protein CAPTEDRAFT_192396 [Capitella teleta]